MARPKIERIVNNPPLFTEFKPRGVSIRFIEEVKLTLDEYEAFRLSDYNGLSQEEAAEEMEISRPTFTRLIEKARKKIADFIVNGKLLNIDGGNIHFRKNIIKCENCGHMFIINFDATFVKCPECSSNKLFNLAGGFGHGNCCKNKFLSKGANYE